MDLTYTEPQRMLKSSIAEFMKREAQPNEIARVFQFQHGYDETLYRHAAEPGWLGMLVPERYGGIEVSIGDCAAGFEEFGRGPLPGPLFSSSVLSSLVLLEGGTEEQKQELLPAMVNAERILSTAGPDRGSEWSPELVTTRITREGAGYVLNGTKAFVHDGEAADTFIVAARGPESGTTLVLVKKSDPGVTVTRQEGLLTALGAVRLDGVRVSEAAILGPKGEGWAILDRAAEKALPVLCAYKVGACQQVFDFTLDYTRTRFAFGQAIGRFQRVQDHVVDLTNQMDGALMITHELLWKMETGQPYEAAVHEAKAIVSEAYYQVCNFAHMVFAGPGTVLDHPLHQHTIMSRTLYQYLGEPGYHKRRMMELMFPIGGAVEAAAHRNGRHADAAR